VVRVGGRSGIGGRVTGGKPGFLDGRSQGKKWTRACCQTFYYYILLIINYPFGQLAVANSSSSRNEATCHLANLESTELANVSAGKAGLT